MYNIMHDARHNSPAATDGSDVSLDKDIKPYEVTIHLHDDEYRINHMHPRVLLYNDRRVSEIYSMGCTH